VNQAVAIDSNMLTNLHDALSPAFDPNGRANFNLVEQKVALVRTVFYWDGTLKIVPTVSVEYQRIQDTARRQSHDAFAMVLFDEIVELELKEVERLKNYYLEFHSDVDDCQIVAEAEAAQLDILITYDADLRLHLGAKLHKLRLMDAQEFWQGLQIPKGASPKILPKQGNPVREKTWWLWK
jgi:predicted nucleic acid-binding protein